MLAEIAKQHESRLLGIMKAAAENAQQAHAGSGYFEIFEQQIKAGIVTHPGLTKFISMLLTMSEEQTFKAYLAKLITN